MREENINSTESKSTSIELAEKVEHPYDMQTVIQEYIDSVDEKIKLAYDRVVKGDLTQSRNIISNVTQKQIQAFKDLAVIDVTDYRNSIDTNGLEHIHIRHGIRGKHDNSMSNSNDVARMKYILENYDEVELIYEKDGITPKTTNAYLNCGEPSKMLMFSKKIDGTYYVIEAATEGKYKRVWVMSAYIKKRVTQTLDEKTPSDNVRNASASPPKNIISNKFNVGNGKM